MASVMKAEVKTEIKSGAQDFYEIFRRKMHLLPKIVPQIIRDTQLLKGDGETVGSVTAWTYALGNTQVPKETLEVIDGQNKAITFNFLDAATITICYETFKETIQVTPKDEGSMVNWTIMYQKQKEGNPDPKRYLELIALITKAVDAYLLNA
ncbi:hypothetical protein L6164_003239 [Bauhinia variegata]|uniref:Uncharacterized protein n=1 Tax=Bauhinia variegata TaxID=167791 RepID=A0ACB9Q042_BAUVA|nr:hypothetical protein L6164_003239 [Bauhinia variegata]